MEIALGTLSSSFTQEGEKIESKWFDFLQSPFGKLNSSLGKANIPDLLNGIAKLTGSVNAVTAWFGKIRGLFSGAAKKFDDVKGTLIKIRDNPSGWVAGGIAALAGAGAIGASVLTGVSVTDMATAALNFGELAYSFNINISDKQLYEEIKEIIKNLYGPAGELIGRGIAQLLIGGLTAAPKVVINIKAISLAWIANPDAREELLSSVSQLAWSGLEAARQILFKFAFLKGRQALKAWYKRAPDNVKKLIPERIRKNIETWGDEGKEPWILEAKVDEKIEKWEAPDEIKDALREGMSGFWDQVRTSVEYKYPG